MKQAVSHLTFFQIHAIFLIISFNSCEFVLDMKESIKINTVLLPSGCKFWN